jgi:2-oxoglutarate dehydrogenase E2 component (dihydrolipoamide succinyltransferase)
VSTGTQIEVVMPQMGVSVSEGTITRWLKQPGENIALDEPLLEISTDKVDTEVPSPGEGVVAEIRVQEGETVEVGTVLATIAPAGAAVAEPEAPAPSAEEAPVEAEVAPSPAEPEPQAPATAETPEPVAAAAAPATPAAATEPAGNGKLFVSPVVARIAAQHGVDPTAVPGTGQGGRVTKKDILAYIESGARAPSAPEPAAVAEAEAPAAAAPAEAEPVAAPPVTAPAPAAAPPAPPAPPRPVPEPVAAAAPVTGEVEEAMNAMRRGVAEHMRRSLDTSAHVTSAIEVDMSRVVAVRERLKKEFQSSYGVNPTYLAFVTKAAVETLKDWPWVNGEMRGEKIVTRPWVNVGIAVALEDGKGLIVPVIRNAQDLNLLGIARAIGELAV